MSSAVIENLTLTCTIYILTPQKLRLEVERMWQEFQRICLKVEILWQEFQRICLKMEILQQMFTEIYYF